MRGDLATTSAADACRALAGEAASGTLVFVGPDGPGAILLTDGAITAAKAPKAPARLGDRLIGAGYLDGASLTRALELQADAPETTRLGALLVEHGFVPADAVRIFVQEQILDALFDLLRWRFGTYEFRPGPGEVAAEIAVTLAVDEVLVEVARRQQEWHELSAVIPDLDAVPTFRGTASANAALEPDEFAVLASIDGERSVRLLAADLGFGEFELARIVYGLSLLGIVDIRLPEDEIGAALDDAINRDDSAFSTFDEPTDTPAAPLDGPDPVVTRAPVWVDPPEWAAAAAPTEHAVPAAPEDDAPPHAPVEPEDAAPPHGAVEPPHDAGLTVEADLPSYRDVMAELRQFDGRVPAEATPPTDDTVATTIGSDDPTDDGPASEHTADVPAAEPAPVPWEAAPDASDVSEFLRELSRLALDDEPEVHSRPTPRPRTDDDVAHDDRRKRRGLFGWGG